MQHFGYQIKMMFRSPMALFWAVAFPIILGALFYFMFGNIGNVEQFSRVPVGIVQEEENDIFMEMIENIKMEEDVPMFDVKEYGSVEEAEEALREEEIQGIVLVKVQDFEMIVKESSIYSSLIKTFLDQYKQNNVLIEDVAVAHPERVAELISSLYQADTIGIKENSLKGQDKSPYTQYFYALLAMACLISSSVGVQNGLNIQADLSAIAARRNLAPTKKIKQVLTDFAATLFIYCILMAVVLAILIFVYKQDFGSNVGLILLGTWVGSFVGLAAGTMLAVVLKGEKAAKEGVAVAFFMVSSFLGGLQWGEITYVLEKNCPIINRINPATLIVNAFKSLAVFGDYRQYAVNLVTLLAIGIVFLAISIIKLR
ncbi:MAG: ABC transporter permease, partial [Lachnospiraceae bacterium]|nr:ABC transporter permease [Lachnospiraceae bacterium]